MQILSVVVCTYNRHELLPKMLGHLLRQTTPPSEVLLVDNEASSDVRSIVTRIAAQATFPLRYIAEPRLGLSRARNRGVIEATSRLIAFLDDDAFAEPTWVAEVLAGAERHSRGGVFAGAVEPVTDGPVPPRLLEEIGGHAVWLGALDLGPGDREMTSQGTAYAGPVGANMIFRREALVQAGPFNPSLGRLGTSLVSGEEVVLVNAARRAGFEVWYLGQARVQHLVHRERLTHGWFLRRSFFEGVSIARALRAEAPEDTAKRSALLSEQARHLVAVLDRAGRTLKAFDLSTRIALATIVGRLIEAASEPSVAANAREALDGLRTHHELLELELPADGASFWAPP